MSKESEAKKDKKTVEEKIDLLIAESEKANLERKRDRVLSKIDGLYNVLIALSTFLVGVMISQHNFFVNTPSFGLFFTIAGIIISMIVSYGVGFMGMVRDSIENRVLSWGLFLTSVPFLGVSYFVPFFAGNDLTSIFGRVSVGLLTVFILTILAKWIVTWVETKISTIVGQETHEWVKIKNKVTLRVGGISTAIFLLTLLISGIVGNFTGMH